MEVTAAFTIGAPNGLFLFRRSVAPDLFATIGKISGVCARSQTKNIGQKKESSITTDIPYNSATALQPAPSATERVPASNV